MEAESKNHGPMNARFIMFALLYVFLGLCNCALCLLLLPYVSFFDSKKKIYIRFHYLQYKILARLFWKTIVTGFPVSQCPQPCVFAFNHQTILDTINTHLAYPHLCKSMVFKGIKVFPSRWFPIVGLLHIFIQNIFVNRSSKESGVKALEDAIKNIREGFSLIISPEGRQSITGKLGRFKMGPFIIACETGVPVVPGRLEMRAIFENDNMLRLRPGTVHYHLCEPIETRGIPPEKVREMTFQAIQSMMNSKN